jgi:O-methyltransferase involved in polyketide biosynthesis
METPTTGGCGDLDSRRGPVPVDPLAERLLDTGFDPSRPAFVSWLGVTQYLTEAAIGATLDVIGGFCPGTQLVIEYLVPSGMRDEAGEALADFFMPRAASFAEPWLTFLTPADVAGLLAARDMVVLDDVGRRHDLTHTVASVATLRSETLLTALQTRDWRLRCEVAATSDSLPLSRVPRRRRVAAAPAG